jgi:hypothetical protein
MIPAIAVAVCCATGTTFNSESYLTSRHTTPESKNTTMGYVLRQIYAIVVQMLHTTVFKIIQLISCTSINAGGNMRTKLMNGIRSFS